MTKTTPAFPVRLAMLAMLACAPAGAANLQISPVMLTLRPDQGAAGVSMLNLGEVPAFGQVRVYQWQQQDGDDVLAPTTDMVASPPIIQIAPKASQIIRLVRRSAQPQADEQCYRVLIDEIPHGDGPTSTGVDIRLRYSVPIFVQGSAAHAQPQLAWSVYRQDGAWMLRLKNSGNMHAQVGALVLVNRAGKEYSLSQGLFGYALAGRVRIWKLPVDKGAELDGPLTIKAGINGQQQTATSVAPE